MTSGVIAGAGSWRSRWWMNFKAQKANKIVPNDRSEA